MVERTVERAAARGMLRAINETLGGLRRSGTPERLGFAVGFMTVAIGLSARARQRHLQRIEEKVDQLVDGPEQEPEQDLDRFAAAREERRQRRLSRRR